MHQLPHEKGQFVPLRRFAVEGLYSVLYISQLVQKGKLKAIKKGRNYSTTRKWFEEYINEHAKDEVREKYVRLFRELDLKESVYNKNLRKGTGVLVESQYNNIVSRLSKTAVLTVAAVFVLLILATIFVPRIIDKDGQVAGEEEVNIEETASSTEIKKLDTRIQETNK